MKRNKLTTSDVLKGALLIGAVSLAKAIEKKANPEKEAHRNEKDLNRKLALTSIIYHAIGVFYNE